MRVHIPGPPPGQHRCDLPAPRYPVNSVAYCEECDTWWRVMEPASQVWTEKEWRRVHWWNLTARRTIRATLEA